MRRITARSPKVVRDALHGLVRVQPMTARGRKAKSPAGSGFLMDGELVVTARHVAGHSSRARCAPAEGGRAFGAVRLKSGTRDIAVRVGTEHLSYDVARYRAARLPAGLRSLRIGRVPRIGAELVVLGIPTGESEPKYTTGRLVRIIRHSGQPALLLFDARTDIGCSGGPVLRADTVEVIGVLGGSIEPVARQYSYAWLFGAKPREPTFRNSLQRK